MATLKRCDRCHKVGEPHQKWGEVCFKEVSAPSLPTTKDLCPDCLTATQEFLATLPESGD